VRRPGKARREAVTLKGMGRGEGGATLHPLLYGGSSY